MQHHLAGDAAVEPATRVERRGLARAVGADQAGDPPERRREAQAVDREQAAEPHHEVLDLEAALALGAAARSVDGGRQCGDHGRHFRRAATTEPFEERLELRRHRGVPAAQCNRHRKEPEQEVEPVVGVLTGDVRGNHRGDAGKDRVPRFGKRRQREDGEQDKRVERREVRVERHGEVHRSGVENPGHRGKERRHAEDDDTGGVGAQPQRRHRSRRLGHPAQYPPEASAVDHDHHECGRDDEGEHEVVVALVALREGRTGDPAPIGESGEHEIARVEEPFDQDRQAEGGEREEQSREPDRRKCDQRADGHDDEARDEQCDEPRQATVERELRERDSADGREGGVTQRHLARRPHQEPE